MVRAPCCWMKGLKKGPWTAEEDDILRSFIEKHGHDNWRALPKKAGLLRCGKSCRLRWTNYLRPDVKRGNFTKEEEDTIIRLHASLGNKWSVIAAQLPGRTDNEIKNTWHTRLKKLVGESNEPRPDGSAISISTQEESQYQENSNTGSPHPPGFEVDSSNTAQVQSISGSPPLGFEVEHSSNAQVQDYPIFSPQPSYDGISSVYTGVDNDYKVGLAGSDISVIESLVPFSEPDESFWPNPVSSEHIKNPVELEMDSWGEDMLQFPEEVVSNSIPAGNYDPVGLWHNEDLNNVFSNDGLDFWYDLFVQSGGFEQLPEFYVQPGQD